MVYPSSKRKRYTDVFVPRRFNTDPHTSTCSQAPQRIFGATTIGKSLVGVIDITLVGIEKHVVSYISVHIKRTNEILD
jgi:hypothetical protein